jgi:hypothetical protein
LPAAAIAGEVAFLLASGDTIYIRGYKAMAVVVGFMSHLVLDEIWSVRIRGGIGLKSSFGTAVKLWSGSTWANLSCYVKLILLSLLVLRDPIWSTVSPEANELHQLASDVPLPTGTIPWLAAPTAAPTPTGISNIPPTNGPPTYQPPPQYFAPPTYGPAPPYYGSPQPYALPPQPYVQPYVQPQQAQSPEYAPYVSPRY